MVSSLAFFSGASKRHRPGLASSRLIPVFTSLCSLLDYSIPNNQVLSQPPLSRTLSAILQVSSSTDQVNLVSKLAHEFNNGVSVKGIDAFRTRYHGSSAPEVLIDIRKENADADQIIYQDWKEHIDQLKKSRLDNDWMMMMSQATLALGGQAVGAVMANALTSSASSASSWSVYFVEFATVLGLTFTLAGISLRRKQQALSTVMTKIGAMAMTSAIVISLASHLPPAMAWIVGPFAVLIMAVAVAFP